MEKDRGPRKGLPKDYPCGVLRCTYEKFPRAVYVNQWMLRFLGTDEDSEEWREFFSQNLFLMIPFEDRELLRDYLNAAREDGEPLVLEHRVVSCAGGCTQLMGWLRLARNREGELEYQFLYMQTPDTRTPPQKQREEAYQYALMQSYDMIFELDHLENTMECVYKKDHIHLWFISAARLMLSETVKQSFLNCVHREDRDRVRACMETVLGEGWRKAGAEQGISLRFRTLHGPHQWEYQVMLLRLDERTSLICGRDITDQKYAMLDAEEIEWLRAMQVCASGMREGFVPKTMLFRLTEDLVYPLSAAANICRFCQITEEELFRAREIGIPMEDFLRRSRVARGECWLALRSGEALLEETLDESVLERHLYVSKVRTDQGEGAVYDLLFIYLLADEPLIPREARPKVRIHTFGHFDVFVDDQPVVFRNEKSKEMLAVLVDRAGGFVANPYVISCLWENEPYNQRLQGRCRQTAHRMMETLRQYGIEDIIEKVDGRRRIIPEKVSCDLFHHKMGVKAPGQYFNGVYMSDYSWGEVTLSGLLKEQENPV